jgi:hypothetical protein
MKLCEYANNLFDMTYLCDIIEENKKVRFRWKDDYGYLMLIRIYAHTIEMAFPIIDMKHNKYLRLKEILIFDTFYYYFTEAVVLSSDIHIHFGD